MEETNDPAARKPRGPKRLLVALAALAFIACGVAAYSWTQRDQTADIPQRVSLEDLGGANLGEADPAPDFSVPTLDGSGFSLSDHLRNEGTPVVLNLWASWCLPCREEMPAIDASAARHPRVKFIGVAVQDDNQAAEEFATDLGVTYTIGFDERDEVNALYPSFGLPVTYIISAEGTILEPLYGELSEGQLDSVLATWFGG